MMWQLLGWAGAMLLSLSVIPQMLMTMKDGHAKGLSGYFIASWTIGEILTLVYVLPTGNIPLIANYVTNLTILSVIVYYKLFPRKVICEA